uniref:Ribosomal protein L5 n=1 Tax=Panagrolaimus superbus TaxID=310955 RepID=A0A914Y6Y2_9BILA
MVVPRILVPSKNISPFFYRNLHSIKKFEIPPRLSVHNGFLLDSRPEGDRKVINPAWKPKSGKNLLRIELIDRKDFGLIGQFFVYQFIKHSNFCRHLQMKYEDLEPFFFELLDNIIDKPLSFAAFDEDKLVGIKLNNFHTADEFPELFPEGLYERNPKYEIKKDYGDSRFFSYF